MLRMNFGGAHMKKFSRFSIVISVVTAAVAIKAAAVAVITFLNKKKKDEEDLEHYLDCSIQ